MLRKIKLYGKLAKFIGHRVLEADVATAAEAVRFLLANWPELEAHMNDQHYRVSIGTYDYRPRGAASPGWRSTDQLRAGGSWCWCSGADYCWDCLNRSGIFGLPVWRQAQQLQDFAGLPQAVGRWHCS
jgi:hypothetical protein